MNLFNSSPVISTESMTRPARLEGLIRNIEQDAHCSPQRLRQHILAANLSTDDLLPWADFQHPVTDSYGRKAVYESEYFEVMVMSWAPGDFSTIHDHGLAQWGAVQCFGDAEHSIYALDEGVLRTVAIEPFRSGAVHAVNPDLIHQMGNPSNRYFLSLHIYGREEPSESITGDAQIFDLFEGCMQLTNGGVFFCLPEALILGRRPGLRGDRPTTLRHHEQMRDRIQRILESQDYLDLNQTPLDALSLQLRLEQLQTQIALLQSQ